MLQASIFEAPELESQQDLGNFRLSEQGDGNVHPASGGPLARFATANIKSTGSAALKMLAHHSIFDAISLQAFFRDLEANIQVRQLQNYTLTTRFSLRPTTSKVNLLPPKPSLPTTCPACAVLHPSAKPPGLYTAASARSLAMTRDTSPTATGLGECPGNLNFA